MEDGLEMVPAVDVEETDLAHTGFDLLWQHGGRKALVDSDAIGATPKRCRFGYSISRLRPVMISTVTDIPAAICCRERQPLMKSMMDWAVAMFGPSNKNCAGFQTKVGAGSVISTLSAFPDSK